MLRLPERLDAPSWGSLGEDIFRRTYSRTKPDGSKEEWAETVKRVVEGNCRFVPKRFIERGEPEKLFNLIYHFKLLPGGRHLWSTGAIGVQTVANCWVSGWGEKFSEHFRFTFARLMEGGGVGANYSNPFVCRYGRIHHPVDVHVVCDEAHKDYEQIRGFLSKKYAASWAGAIQVEDSREGWVDALGLMLDLYYEKGERAKEVVFDVSHVRPSGSRLKRFGGVASGPAALVEMLLSVADRMNAAVGTKPDSFLCLDIDHEIARCVVAGSSRRSARMSMKHWKDEDIERFLDLKADGSAHWTTNISIVLDSYFWLALRRKDAHAQKIMRMIAEGALSNGEPGIFNITKANEGEPNKIVCTNPCGEITLPEWGSCILGSVNLGKFAHDLAGMLEAFRLMTRFLIRATYADYPEGPAREVVLRDRRIGVGFTGFADWLVREGVRFSEFPSAERQKTALQKAAKMVRNAAREYAFELRIPEPVKVSTCAPTGSTSKLAGCSEGMQPVMFRYFRRRVAYLMSDENQRKIVEEAEKNGLDVEDSLYSPNTKVVSYICRAKILDDPEIDPGLVEESTDLTLEEYLDVQKTVQDSYVDNSISFTVNVDPEKVTVEDVERALIAFGPHLKGTTVMPTVSNRPQMPYERIEKEDYDAAEMKFSAAGELECKNNSCRIVLQDD